MSQRWQGRTRRSCCLCRIRTRRFASRNPVGFALSHHMQLPCPTCVQKRLPTHPPLLRNFEYLSLCTLVLHHLHVRNSYSRHSTHTHTPAACASASASPSPHLSTLACNAWCAATDVSARVRVATGVGSSTHAPRAKQKIKEVKKKFTTNPLLNDELVERLGWHRPAPAHLFPFRDNSHPNSRQGTETASDTCISCVAEREYHIYLCFVVRAFDTVLTPPP